MTQAYNLSQFANFLNSSGQVSASGLQSGVTLASGTVSLFYQSAAPTGWTQVTSLNDYDMRLVSSGGGTTGGTTAYSTVFTNVTIAAPTISATTLSLSQIPSHNHQANAIYGGPDIVTGGQYVYQTSVIGAYNTCNPTASVAPNGGGGSHTHTVSGGGGTVTLNVRYANIILCSKN